MISRVGMRVRLGIVALGVVGALLTTVAAAIADDDQAGGNPQSSGPVFVLDKGRFSVFDPPGVNANELIDVNDRGQVAGTYVDDSGVSHGFLRGKRGRFALIDAPGAMATFILKINDRGQIVGNACDADPCETQRAYVRDPRGRFTTIRFPGSVNTQALGLDDRGRIVGSYRDTSGTEHGYVWQRGRFATIDVPGATLSQLTAINDRGEMLGLYLDADGDPHGFHRDPRGRITTLDAPGAAFTLPFDINDRGRIVGFTTNALPLPDADEVHGFVLRYGPDSPFTRIDVPGAPRTLASGIDDRGRVVGIYENPNATTRVPQPMLDTLPLVLSNAEVTP